MIKQHPEDQNRIYEEEVYLYVVVSGPGIINYQWMKDGTPVSDISLPHCIGADTATLHFTSFSPEHNGLYRCEVSNNYNCRLLSDAANIYGKFMMCV